MNTIDVIEFGTNIPKSILVHNIKMIESMIYKSGETVTVISFIDDSEIHVTQPLALIKKLIND
jgi:hypothetical protein